MKLRNNEEKLALFLAKFIVIILAIVFNTGRLLARVLWKLKRSLYTLGLLIVAVYLPLMIANNIAYAPRANAVLNGYSYVSSPTTEHQKIINYIYEVFGKDAPKAFKLLTGNAFCHGENGSLNPNARNWNSDGSIDYSIFQINNRWQGVSNQAFLFDWRINILMAHNIYIRSGNTFKMWTGGKCQGI